MIRARHRFVSLILVSLIQWRKTMEEGDSPVSSDGEESAEAADQETAGMTA